MGQYSETANHSAASNKFALAALMMGVCSLFTISSVVIPFVLGSLAIIFAILSKGPQEKMSSQAKYGFALSLGSILLAFTLTVTSVSLYLFNDTWRQTVNDTYEEIYVFTLEEYMELLWETDSNTTLYNEAMPQ